MVFLIKIWFFCLVVFCFVVLVVVVQVDEEKLLWEIGVGVVVLSFLLYWGLDQINNFLMLVFYFIYYGDFLKVDCYGICGSIFGFDWVDLMVSLVLLLLVLSEDIDVCFNMLDFEGIFEIGL